MNINFKPISSQLGLPSQDFPGKTISHFHAVYMLNQGVFHFTLYR